MTSIRIEHADNTGQARAIKVEEWQPNVDPESPDVCVNNYFLNNPADMVLLTVNQGNYFKIMEV